MKETDSDLLELAQERFKLVQDAESDQRQNEKDDLRFQVPELMWDEDSKRNRLGDSVAGVPVPPRPILSIPMLDQPIQLVLNQQRSANLGIQTHPISAEADDDTAEVIQGIVRMIERDSHADQARSWGFDRAVKAGRGAYRVITQYSDDPGQHAFDQDIRIERILHQDACYFDPSASEPDWSDGRWAFVTTWIPRKEFASQYPDSEVAKAEAGGDDLFWQNAEAETPQWVKEGSVLLAEYWYKETKKERIWLDEQSGETFNKEETRAVHPDMNDAQFSLAFDEHVKGLPTREKDVDTVWFCKITGMEVIEKQEWNGRFIPLIPVIGRELQPFDDKRRWMGIIRPAKDSQRLYNYAASGAVEMAALEPKAPWLMAEGQDEGYEDEWQQSNIRNLPVLRYKQKDVDGQPAPVPQRTPASIERLGPNMALLQEASGFIQAATATFDPSLGKLPQKDRSGRAIIALQGQSDAGNSHYLQNLAEVSMTYEAKVLLDLIPRIYDRPGRIVRILNPQDDSSSVMLNQWFVENPDGELIPAQLDQEGNPVDAPPKNEASQQPQKPKMFNLTEGVYGVTVSIGKSWQTRTEQAADEIGQILMARPELMPLLGPIYFKHRDMPESKEISDMLLRLAEKQFPGVVGDEEDGPTPEQLMGKLQEQGQQMEQMGQALQMAQKEIETDRVKAEADLAKVKLQNEGRLEVEKMKTMKDLMLEEMGEKFKRIEALLTREEAGKSRRAAAVHDIGRLETQASIDADARAEMPTPAPASTTPLDTE